MNTGTGQSVKLRFSLLSDDLYEADGIYLDDVSLSEVAVFQYDGTQYRHSEGTSFAAPLVAGVAALILSQDPNLTHLETRDLILASVDHPPALSGKVATNGRLNAHQALQMLPEPSLTLLQLAGIGALLILHRWRPL